MTINGEKFLDNPLAYRGGETLILTSTDTSIIPLNKDFFFILDIPKKEVKKKDIALLDAEGKMIEKDSLKEGAKIIVVATGPLCEAVKCGDTIYPGGGFLGTSADLNMPGYTSKFGIQKEAYAKGIFFTV